MNNRTNTEKPKGGIITVMGVLFNISLAHTQVSVRKQSRRESLFLSLQITIIACAAEISGPFSTRGLAVNHSEKT